MERERLIAVAVELVGFGLIALVLITGEVLLIVAGTVVLIIGVAIWQTSDPQGYNNATGIAKMIQDVDNLTVDTLFHTLSQISTPFGKAWLGRVKMIRSPCIILGPGHDGSFVYLYMKHGSIYVSQCTSPFWLNVSKDKRDKIREQLDGSQVTFYRFSGDAYALVNWLYEYINETLIH